MKNILGLCLFVLASQAAFASAPKSALCQQLKRAVDGSIGSIHNLNEALGVKVLSMEFDVSPDEHFIASRGGMHPLELRMCAGAISVAHIQVGNHPDILKVYATTEDRCDGGNTFGAVYNLTTQEELATINDLELECAGEE